MSWRLIGKTDSIPTVEVWEYKRVGLKVHLTFTYVYDEKGRRRLFGNVSVRFNNYGKIHSLTVQQLLKLFERKGIPAPDFILEAERQ